MPLEIEEWEWSEEHTDFSISTMYEEAADLAKQLAGKLVSVHSSLLRITHNMFVYVSCCSSFFMLLLSMFAVLCLTM